MTHLIHITGGHSHNKADLIVILQHEQPAVCTNESMKLQMHEQTRSQKAFTVSNRRTRTSFF